jgi:predicted MFS family arabinose efflux permease
VDVERQGPRSEGARAGAGQEPPHDPFAGGAEAGVPPNGQPASSILRPPQAVADLLRAPQTSLPAPLSDAAQASPAQGGAVAADPPSQSPASVAAAQPDDDFVRLIGTSTGVKLIMDTGVQVFNPFLGLIATGLGSSVVVLGRLLSLRSLMGLTAPAFGSLTKRIGYRRTIQLSLFSAALGISIVGISPNVWVAALGMIIMGFGTGSFVPLLQAYLSGRLPYHRRAQGLGIVEYSWALTGIIMLPIMGLLIAATNWRVPLLLIGLLLFCAAFVIMSLPPTRHLGTLAAPAPVPRSAAGTSGAPASRTFAGRVTDFFHLPGNARSTYATIATGALIYVAGLQVMIIYGTWLGVEYGLGAAALGTVAFVFGWFDLTASVAVSLFTDRMGKKVAVLVGALVAVVGYAGAVWWTLPMVGAIVLIGVARMGFEFAIVSYFPLLSEQQPTERSKTMTLGSAIMLTFATASGFSAPWLFTRYGMQGVVLVSGIATLLAIAVLLTLVQDAGNGSL